MGNPNKNELFGSTSHSIGDIMGAFHNSRQLANVAHANQSLQGLVGQLVNNSAAPAGLGQGIMAQAAKAQYYLDREITARLASLPATPDPPEPAPRMVEFPTARKIEIP